jgi:hypothetical protein
MAGLAPGMKLISINDLPFSAQVLHDEIAKAQQSKKPLQMRAESDGAIELHTINYDGGLKYPHLIRLPGTTDYLEQVLAPKPVDAGS